MYVSPTLVPFVNCNLCAGLSIVNPEVPVDLQLFGVNGVVVVEGHIALDRSSCMESV